MDSELAKVLKHVPDKRVFRRDWAKPLPFDEGDEYVCETCNEWRKVFGLRAAELLNEYEWKTDEQKQKYADRCKQVEIHGNHAYEARICYVTKSDEEDPTPPTLPAEENVRFARWFERGGDTASARAKTFVVQNICCLLLCCGCMPVLGLIEGILLFPVGAVFGVVLSLVIASGMAMRCFQYFFYYSKLGVGYKIFYAWVPCLYVLAVVPVTFVGSLAFGLISSLVMPAVLMIKLDTWFPVVSTLVWQYGKALPQVIELTYGEKGKVMAMQPRPRLEKGLRYTIGILLVVPAQALIAVAIGGPCFTVVCLTMILPAIPLRFTQWFWVYGVAKNWKLSTAPGWIVLAPLWLLVTLLAFPIAILSTVCAAFGYMLIAPFGVMLNDGNLFPLWEVTRRAFGDILSEVHKRTLGDIGHSKVATARELKDIHCWWIPSLPFLVIGGFFVWLVALLVLVLVRFLPFFVYHMISIWGSWYKEAGFSERVSGKSRLSAAFKRVAWLILAIPMLLYSLVFLVLEVPIGFIVALFVAFFYGACCAPLFICSEGELDLQEDYDTFYGVYSWSNKYFCCSKRRGEHDGCLPKPPLGCIK